LSDIRLNRKNDNINDLKNAFLYNGSSAYNFFYNSSKSSRGVGILIKNNLDISEIEEYKDENENILGITCFISGKKIRLISIYGPNLDAHTIFFINLRQYLDRDRTIPTVIGGDWNLTFSTENSIHNIDIHAMIAPPSIFRSRALQNIYSELHLSDPYRLLHPIKRDFTYIPRNGNDNRSRIDFF
jgi:exonuclease III